MIHLESDAPHLNLTEEKYQKTASGKEKLENPPNHFIPFIHSKA